MTKAADIEDKCLLSAACWPLSLQPPTTTSNLNWDQPRWAALTSSSSVFRSSLPRLSLSFTNSRNVNLDCFQLYGSSSSSFSPSAVQEPAEQQTQNKSSVPHHRYEPSSASWFWLFSIEAFRCVVLCVHVRRVKLRLPLWVSAGCKLSLMNGMVWRGEEGEPVSACRHSQLPHTLKKIWLKKNMRNHNSQTQRTYFRFYEHTDMK